MRPAGYLGYNRSSLLIDTDEPRCYSDTWESGNLRGSGDVFSQVSRSTSGAVNSVAYTSQEGHTHR